jgi:hypothetical protein
MITEELTKILSEISFKPEEIDTNVFRVCQTDTTGKPFAIRFFDCTENITSPNFDISLYQENWLRKEYFRVSGSLQWNTYCYFLCEDSKYAELQREHKIESVESDMIYARKFVRTLGLVKREFFKGEKEVSLLDPILGPDIATVWRDILSKNNLALLV